jgi:hypothetical protein
MVWFRKAAAQGLPPAVRAVQLGTPGMGAYRDMMVRFTNAGSAPARHAAAHGFARMVHEDYLEPQLEMCKYTLKEFDSILPHQSLRDSTWVDFLLGTSISEEEIELAKNMYAYSLRTCAFCGSNSAPLRNCSLCMEVRYCIATECQHAAWNTTPAAESHKVLCPRIFVRGSKGRTRRA